MSEERTTESAVAHKSIPPLSGLRLLIVDDSVDNQILFSRFLAGAGAEVLTAGNGVDAVEKFSQAIQSGRPFDVIVMDIRMPIMDGYEASRQIRKAGFVGPIVALTAHAVPGEEGRCRSAGCSEFLTKPVDRARLTQAILIAAEATHNSSTHLDVGL